MKTLLVGIGAAGNKAVMTALEMGIVTDEDTIIVNSTSKDFPPEYEGMKITTSPNNTGCGKERSVAKDYTMSAIKAGKFNLEILANYTTVIICTSVEGGTGSGSTPRIAQFFNQVYRKNVHIIAFAGFEEDPRGLANTIEFFKEVDSKLIVQCISNKEFLKAAKGNKFKAEKLANEEMCERIKILTGQKFIDSEQNIDDTDILKVSNTSGYMTVESKFVDKPLVDQEDFNALVKKMIYDSKSLKSLEPGAIRLGVILNIKPETEDAIDYSFASIKEAYGDPYECFMQKQWDGEEEYIAIIASGMQMPLDELEKIYERYNERTAKVNKASDQFYSMMNKIDLNEEDKKFDMIKPVENGLNVEDFMKQFETK